MVRFRLLSILFALLAGGARLSAAGSAENRAFGMATNEFNVGFWEQSEKDFAAFTNKYPNSAYLPDAALYQGRAKFQLKQFPAAIELLSATQSKAGPLRDQYLYWIGRAQFENTNYPAAAAAFAELTRSFPDSPRRLDAAIREAASRARLEDWAGVAALLVQTDGVFQTTARGGSTNPLIAAGYLLLGEAQLQQKNIPAAQTALQGAEKFSPGPELTWRRQYLQSRLLREDGRLEEALTNALRLPASPDPADRAEGVAFAAGVLEQLQRFDDAMAAYRQNLARDVPVPQQRRALLKMAELSLAQNETRDAIQTLERYLAQFPVDAVADLATLTLGELQLREALAGAETNAAALDTNSLARALTQFDALLARFPNSPFAGKALLDKGWCLWLDGNQSGSSDKLARGGEQFRLATTRLTNALDLAVARFKWADAQFQSHDLAGAVTNYDYLVENFSTVPEVQQQLLELALYQTVRTALDANDPASATKALRKILDWYPNGFAGPSALLLTGQGLARNQDTAGARALFAEFEQRYPGDPLLPELRLAIARAYEQEGSWDAAINSYAGWLNEHTNHAERPQAEFSRAWDTYMAGRETNALALFTNFVARYSTSELAPRAQWWIGDFYYRHGDFYDAEYNYQPIYQNTNWPVSDLTCRAKMMAGFAAVARQNYRDAVRYFTNLVSDANCPAELRTQAALAAGDAWVSRTDLGETNRQAAFEEAIGWFKTIAPTNAQAPAAWGRLGECFLQMAAADDRQYETASNYFQQVVGSPLADAGLRSQAKVRLAFVAEKQAALKSGDEEDALLKVALAYYLEVFYDPDLRDHPRPEWLFWMKKAGLEAGRLAEALQQWQQAVNVYCQLKDVLPPLRATAENKVQKALEKCPDCTDCNGARPVAVAPK